ncbi:hypothetical protein [Pseudarthrobacter sp. BIM B-2242]|uniref:hypothetical protein n=1 Tax=Pseudarthrobacter sp. BIM B-2242 TaxID=2772401 RepID=UPI00168BD628|nr:hypothetical protein [Pseudarthrobacter sp. BIM B-2242]QOD04882.1 hypothetical protein IDT60_07670 [Pseudarthrobacter sp. BIM B-2242]
MQTIKAPTTVAQLGAMAEEMRLTLPELLDLLRDVIGDEWWNSDEEVTTYSATFYPATVRELFAMAEERGMTAPRLLEVLGSFPEPPAGYTMSECVDGLWTAPEIEVAGMVIVPAWNYRTQEHYLELWTGKCTEDESLANLSLADAYDVAAELIAAAKAAQTAGRTV